MEALKVITITHTRAEGTLCHGSTRGDGVLDVLRSVHKHWRPFRSLGCLGLVMTRDKAARTWDIRRAADALRAAGYEVEVSIDDGERRDVATIEAERAQRTEARAERLTERAERTSAQAMADYGKARQMADAIPFGQPMMPDHYSYGRDKRYRERMGRTFDRAFAGMNEAEELQRRAETAQTSQRHREAVPVTLRRIKGLEADERRIQRKLTGQLEYVSDGSGGHKMTLRKPGEAYAARLQAALADVQEQLAYWREHVKAAEASGVKVWTRADFTKGDFVQFLDTWYEVLRVNGKSVTIPAMISDGHVVTKANSRLTWTDTVPYDKVTGRKSADEMAALLAEAQQQKAAAS